MRKRILLVLSVALVIVLMLGAVASPAFAKNCVQPCGQTNTNIGEVENDLNAGNSGGNPSTNDGGDKGNTTNTGSKGQGGTRFGDGRN